MLINQQPATFDKKFARKLRIAIVRANYHHELVTNLEAFARATLLTAGVHEKNIKAFEVPGSWEIPILVQKIAESKKAKFDGIITLGVIVKGETFHFELIANEVTSALMQLSIDNHVPIAFEILAVSNIQHAQARAGKDTGNKGIEAANAVLQTILSLRRIPK
jgi:6,7-dimethyl-8-ribityllumazine synthase